MPRGVDGDALLKICQADVTKDLQESLEEVEITAEDLTPAELQAFRHAVASGQLNKFVDAWVPWWHLPEAATAQLSASGTSRISIQDAGMPYPAGT